MSAGSVRTRERGLINVVVAEFFSIGGRNKIFVILKSSLDVNFSYHSFFPNSELESFESVFRILLRIEEEKDTINNKRRYQTLLLGLDQNLL